MPKVAQKFLVWIPFCVLIILMIYSSGTVGNGVWKIEPNAIATFAFALGYLCGKHSGIR